LPFFWNSPNNKWQNQGSDSIEVLVTMKNAGGKSLASQPYIKGLKKIYIDLGLQAASI